MFAIKLFLSEADWDYLTEQIVDADGYAPTHSRAR
jgi:hypothetical protein